jgi:hypothetical protein
MDWTNWVRFLTGEVMGFSLRHRVQTDSGAHCLTDTGGLFVTIHLYPLPILIMPVAIPPLPNMSSRCGACLSTGIT